MVEDLRAYEKQRIDFWLKQAEDELHPFSDAERVRFLFNQMHDLGIIKYYELPEDKGVVAYIIADDFKGGKTVSELFLYIPPEHRKGVKLFKELINHLETAAKEQGCTSVKIASNIGYNDDKVLRCLQLFGYKTDVVSKEI